jgi:predicted nucleic acid-binding protein
MIKFVEKQYRLLRVGVEFDKILVCALESEADFIISGDHHLVEVKEFQGITIVKPATFLSIVRSEEQPFI